MTKNELAEKSKIVLSKIWAYIKLAKIELLVIFGVLFFDLLTKFLIAKNMSVGETKVVIPNFFNFHYVLNDKAAFSSSFGLEKILGINGVRIFFIFITTIAVAAFCFFLFKFRGKHILARLSLALIITGALGNYYDRVFLGKVRDFAEIVFFGLDLPLLGESFAIFNIADMALVFGVIIFAIYFIFMYDTKKQFVGPIFQPDYVTGSENNIEEKIAVEEKTNKEENMTDKEKTAEVNKEESTDNDGN